MQISHRNALPQKKALLFCSTAASLLDLTEIAFAAGIMSFLGKDDVLLFEKSAWVCVFFISQ